MGEVRFDIEYTERRNRLTSAFRMILAIPHLFVVTALGYAVQAVTVVQWFAILFTGRRIDGLWRFANGFVSWQARANTYAGLMYDTYPNFGFEAGAEPVRYGLEQPREADRLTNGLRFLWAIPALVISAVLAIAAVAVTLVSWFAIVITGRHPRGMFDFMLKAHRYTTRTSAYVYLLTDTYPSYG